MEVVHRKPIINFAYCKVYGCLYVKVPLKGCPSIYCMFMFSIYSCSHFVRDQLFITWGVREIWGESLGLLLRKRGVVFQSVKFINSYLLVHM